MGTPHLHFCADPPDPWLVQSSMGGNGSGECVLPLVFGSCLYRCRKWVKVYLSFLACCFNWLLWYLAAQLFQLSWAPDNNQKLNWKPPLCQVRKYFISLDTHTFLQNKQDSPSHHVILQSYLLSTQDAPQIQGTWPMLVLRLCLCLPKS